MKSKVEFYNAFFKTLNEKGFTVEEPSSPDYLVDIRHRGKIIAFYTKGDVIMKNPFEEAQDKLLERIEQLALATADVCGICADQPYEEEKVQKLANGVVKINEHDNVILACKHHPLFGYVLSTYRQDTENNNMPIQRQYFYNKEEAFESFAARSGLVDEKKLFTESELKILHSSLINMRLEDQENSPEQLETIGKLIERIEEAVPELHKPERPFAINHLFGSWGLGQMLER